MSPGASNDSITLDSNFKVRSSPNADPTGRITSNIKPNMNRLPRFIINSFNYHSNKLYFAGVASVKLKNEFPSL